MRVTSTEVEFQLLNNEAQEDCIFTSSSKKSFANLGLLSKIDKPILNFTTCELNRSILNGSLAHIDLSQENNIAFVSNGISDENCQFNNVWITGTLANVHKFIGITLDFGANYPKKITVDYFKDNIKVSSKIIDNIDDNWIFVDMKANSIDKVTINFNESWFPNEFAYLQEFLFGDIIEWESEDIISANLQEETDVISKILPNDKFEVTIFSKNDEFNVLNPRGAYSFLLPDQKFTITEKIYDDETSQTTVLNLGTFFLDTWESLFDRQIKFNLISPLAVLDKTQFKKSRMYTGISTDNAKKILENIFLDAEWENFEIHENLANVFLTGYIPVCTHKQAIQHIAFVCCCIVYDNRGEKIIIKPYDTAIMQEISTENIFEPIKIERKESVTGINIAVHKFELKSNSEEVFKGFLQKGKHEIIFSNPCTNLTSGNSNVQIIESGINYAILNVLASGEYSISGRKYEDKSYKYLKQVTGTNIIKQNVIEIDKATLISPNIAKGLAEYLLNFYQMYNMVVEFKYISNGELTGQNAIFKNLDGNVFVGSFVRQNINVSGGFLSNCHLIGYQKVEIGDPNYLYSAEIPYPELYAGEDYGLI